MAPLAILPTDVATSSMAFLFSSTEISKSCDALDTFSAKSIMLFTISPTLRINRFTDSLSSSSSSFVCISMRYVKSPPFALKALSLFLNCPMGCAIRCAKNPPKITAIIKAIIL